MTNKIYSTYEIKAMISGVAAEYGIETVYLFGSYAKGTAVKNSDVDILVDSGMKGMAFFGLVEDIVTALDKDADILDVTQIIPDSEVEREINKTGVLIYGE